MNRKANIHDKPLSQGHLENKDDLHRYTENPSDGLHNTTNNYLDELDPDDVINDDYDVDLKVYISPPSFRKFALNPFDWLDDRKKIDCKSGQIKLPDAIIKEYTVNRSWDFNNYHYMELLALLYLDFFKNCTEWQNQEILNSEIKTILEAIPHFNTIEELFTYAYMNNDLKFDDFNQILEYDGEIERDVTHIADD